MSKTTRNWLMNTRKRVEADGRAFDSKGEFNRWQELSILEKAGEISRLEFKPSLRLNVNGNDITKKEFSIDFRYKEILETKPGQFQEVWVYEDYKGYKPTREFAIKWKLAKALYPQHHFRLSGNPKG